MSTEVTIEQRYIGPPGSGNGGYACGVAASALKHDGVIEVSLRLPPPVGRPLRVESAEDRAGLYDGSELVAAARPSQLDLSPPEPITYERATESAGGFDVDTYRKGHPFPTCFTCGPDRAVGDGLRIFPGETGRPSTIAWPWIPDASLDDGSGRVAPEYLWAALDCPSGLAWFHDPEDAPPCVLGRLTAQIHRCPAPGERTVVGGWLRDIDGRKRHSASVLWSAEGEVLALAAATWLELTPEQWAGFGVAGL